jgi:hypothetical protein
MQYFYRAHGTPETALDAARAFFGARGFAPGWSGADRQRFTDGRGTIDVRIEVEGGHYTRVTVSTTDVAESELDKLAKRFLAELHAREEPRHVVRGAY